MQVIGARASAVCKRILLFHLTPLCEERRRLRIVGVILVGVGECVRTSMMMRPNVAWVTRARTGSSRGKDECRVARWIRLVSPMRMIVNWLEVEPWL